MKDKLACVCNSYKIPFHVFCESFKFSENCQIDSLSMNELTEDAFAASGNYKQLSLMYDVTQSHHINMVVTEIGLIPPTSVKAVIREFLKYNYVDKIELPSMGD